MRVKSWTVKPATGAHVNRIARRIRAVDGIECAAGGRTPKEALRLGLKASTQAVTFLLDGKPVAMLGIVPESIIEGRATAWMLGTDEVDRAARVIVKIGPGLLAKMREDWPRLENIVAVRNVKAIRMLRWLGFAFDDEIRYVRGVAFRRFRIGF